MADAVSTHPNVGDVRGEGLICAVEFLEDKNSRKFYEPAGKIGPAIATALLKINVIARAMPQGDIIGFAPPLCLTQDEASTIITATKAAIEEVFLK